MRERRSRPLDGLLLGGIAGIVGTMAMTTAMRAGFKLLPGADQYPLPPREITQRVLGRNARAGVLPAVSLAGHFAYGALAAALLAMSERRPGLLRGAIQGAAIWSTSYFGWVPGLNILRPASDHPLPRNMLMLGAHLIWGCATVTSLNELERACLTILADGPMRDVPKTFPRL